MTSPYRHRLPAAAALSLAVAAFLTYALLAAPPAAAQQFGGVAAVAEGQVLVGEPGNQTLPGIVYVYARSGDGWTEAGRLTVSPIDAPPDGFGRSLDADGSMAVIGAPGWDGGRGAAMIYQRNQAGEWAEVARLSPDELGDDARFGSAVAIDGGMVLVAAAGASEGAGAVHVFTGSGADWVSRAEVLPMDGAGQGFGTGLAFAGGATLVTTAASRDAPTEVYGFTVDAVSGMAGPVGRLHPDNDLGERSGFGAALAVRGSVGLVGAPGAAGGAGAVVTFGLDAETGAWVPGGVLRPFYSSGRDQFGAALGFDGDQLWVGAPGANTRMGAVYRFDRDGASGWGGVTLSARDDLADNASFGSSVAVAGDVAVVGAGGIDSRAGGAVIMARGAGGMWAGGDLVIGDHRGLPAIVGMDDEIPCVEGDAAGYECDNVNIISFLPIKEMAGGRGARLNDIWGWTDPETGREIAIVGRTDGTAFVDLTDPYNPVMLGDLPKTPGSFSSVWRDMKVHDDHTYIVADGAGQHGVQVFDLRRLREVGGELVTFEPDFLYEDIASAHNIVINEGTGFAYVVGSSGGGETCGGGLHMLDLSEPSEPTFAGCFFDGQTGRRGTGYSHDAQCVIYQGPDEDYQGREICLGSNETALSISDVTDKDNPVMVSMADYPAVAYAHQGWLTDDHRFFYMNDEGDEPQGLVEGTRTLIWDVEDLDEPILAAEYIASTPDTDHNLYIRDNLMYQSNYGAGLRILDITDRTDPVEIAYFDNSPYGGASWSNYPYFESGVVVMTSTGDGLFIVRNTGRRNLIP
ncbi:MAG: choice-of-anchor B family protein [Gemmatimonadota bacterium]|nr:choice-of-anchor B family protein [Gemmatimonadota bacterium]